MKKTRISILSNLFLIGLFLISQNSICQPILGWQKIIGTEESDHPVSLVITKDQGFAIAVNFKRVEEYDGRKKLNPDFKVTKFDHKGDLDWERSFTAPNNDLAISMIQTSDGGFALLAKSNSKSGDVKYNYGGYDVVVIKLGPLGDVRWTKNYGGSGEDVGNNIKELADGNLMIVGSTNSLDKDIKVEENFGHKDFWLLKIDEKGNVIKSTIFGDKMEDFGNDFVEERDGTFVITGYSFSKDDERFNAGGADICLLRVNMEGDVFWFKNFGGRSSDKGTSLQKLTNGNYLVMGSTTSVNEDVKCNLGGRDIWILKVKSNGVMEENWCLGGGEYDVENNMSTTNDNGFVIAAQSKSHDGDLEDNVGDYDSWVVKLNSNLEIDWKVNLGGYLKDAAIDVRQKADGTFIVLAETNSKESMDLIGKFDTWIYELKDPNAKPMEVAKPTGFKLDLKSTNIKEDYFRLGIDAPTAGHCVVEIVDIEEKSFLYDTKNLNSGKNSFTFFIDVVPNGHYKLKVTMDGDVAVVPIKIEY